MQNELSIKLEELNAEKISLYKEIGKIRVKEMALIKQLDTLKVTNANKTTR